MSLSSRYLIVLIGVLFCGTAAASCWTVVPAKSQLNFRVEQADGSLTGSFTKYAGRFCSDAGETPAVKVTVDLTSVQTGLPELDEALRGEDFFAMGQWPKGRFVSTRVVAGDAGDYSVTGTLQLRDKQQTLTVPVSFRPAADGKSASLKTHFSLQRLDYGIGQGQWADTEWVGNTVTISVDAVLVPFAEPGS